MASRGWKGKDHHRGVGGKSDFSAAGNVYNGVDGLMTKVKQGSDLSVVLPPVRYDDKVELDPVFVESIEWLKSLPHYFGDNAMFVLSPIALAPKVDKTQGVAINKARQLYDEMLALHRKGTSYNPGSEFGLAKEYDPETKQKTVVMPNLLNDEKPSKYFSVPIYYAASIYKQAAMYINIPDWLSNVATPDQFEAKIVKYVDPSLPPVNSLKGFDKDDFCVKNLTLNTSLYREPYDQAAVVATGIRQIRRSLVHGQNASNNTNPNFLKGCIIAQPPAAGKTIEMLAIWLWMRRKIFNTIPNEDFGLIDSLPEEDQASREQKRRDDILSAFESDDEDDATVKKPSRSNKDKTAWNTWVESLEDKNELYTCNEPCETVKALFIVRGVRMVKQWKRKIREKVGGDVRVGILQGAHKDNPKNFDCIVASADTVATSDLPPGYLDHFGLWFLDEAHMAFASKYRDKMVPRLMRSIPFGFAFTGTPRSFPLRWIYGPLAVYASRPYIPQLHLVFLHGGVPAALRPERKMAKFGRVTDKNPMDRMTMLFDMAIDPERNALIIDVFYDLFGRPNVGETAFGDRQLALVTERLNKSNMKSLMESIYQSGTVDIRNNGANQVVHPIMKRVKVVTLDGENPLTKEEDDPSLPGRIPIMFSDLVAHLIMLQHMYAAHHCNQLRASDPFGDYRIVRTTLAQIAIVNWNDLSDEMKSRIVFLRQDGVNQPRLSPREEDKDMTTIGLHDPHWWHQVWFNRYPACEQHALDRKVDFPFDNEDSAASQRAKKKRKSVENAFEDKDSKSELKLKDLKSSQWMHRCQYEWTPCYTPFPKVVKSKSKDDLSDEEFKDDERPPLPTIATFGLGIGINQLTPDDDPHVGFMRLRDLHIEHALATSDYIFANPDVAGTGFDRPPVKGTFAVLDQGELEQLHGRGMRRCDDVQKIAVHAEIADPYSCMKEHTCKHVEFMAFQNATTRLYISGVQSQPK